MRWINRVEKIDTEPIGYRNPAKMTPIDARMSYFRDLHRNEWFNVMNWVLDELRLPKQSRRRHLISHCFYFEHKQLKNPVFNYKVL